MAEHDDVAEAAQTEVAYWNATRHRRHMLEEVGTVARILKDNTLGAIPRAMASDLADRLFAAMVYNDLED